MTRDGKIEDRVAEKLEPLIIVAGGAAMSERGDEHIGIARLISESLTNPTQWPVGARHPLDIAPMEPASIPAATLERDGLVERDQQKNVREQRRLVVVDGLDHPLPRGVADLDVFYIRKLATLDIEARGQRRLDAVDGGAISGELDLHLVQRMAHIHEVQVDRCDADTGVKHDRHGDQ